MSQEEYLLGQFEIIFSLPTSYSLCPKNIFNEFLFVFVQYTWIMLRNRGTDKKYKGGQFQGSTPTYRQTQTERGKKKGKKDRARE